MDLQGNDGLRKKNYENVIFCWVGYFMLISWGIRKKIIFFRVINYYCLFVL